MGLEATNHCTLPQASMFSSWPTLVMCSATSSDSGCVVTAADAGVVVSDSSASRSRRHMPRPVRLLRDGLRAVISSSFSARDSN